MVRPATPFGLTYRTQYNIHKIAEGLIAMAVKEKDNYETVTVTAKVARKDKDGRRVKQIIDKDTKAVLSETHRDKDGKILRIEFSVLCHNNNSFLHSWYARPRPSDLHTGRNTISTKVTAPLTPLGLTDGEQ